MIPNEKLRDLLDAMITEGVPDVHVPPAEQQARLRATLDEMSSDGIDDEPRLKE